MSIEEKYKQQLLDNRVLKKYTEDLREQIKQLKQQLECKNKALIFAKSCLMIPSYKLDCKTALKEIRQLELFSNTFSNKETSQNASAD